MRTLNLRLAIILLAIVIVGGPSIYAIHYFQQKRNAQFVLEKAEVYKLEAENAKKEKDTEKETKALEKQLKNLEMYLSFNPHDMEVMEIAGLLRAEHLVDDLSLKKALAMLDQVVREDESRDKARRKLVELMLLRQVARYSDARMHINYLLKDPKNKDNPELWQYLGLCEEAQDEEKNAQKSYEKAIKYAPERVEGYPQLANLLRRRLAKPKEAYECMQKMIENNPKSAEAYIYLSDYLQNIPSKDEAKNVSGAEFDPKEESMKAVEKALELSPDNASALMLAARCAIAMNDWEKAQKYCEHNMKMHKDDAQIYVVLAEILAHFKERVKAIEVLDNGLKETKNSPDLLWKKANYLIDEKQLADAKDTIKKLDESSFPKFLIEYLDARIAIAEKKWADAAARLEAVRPSLSNLPVAMASQLRLQLDLSIGYCYGQLHNVDKQIGAYQRVLAVDPFFAPARQGLTDALLSAGRLDDAVREYATLIKTGKVPPAGLINFASILIRQKQQQSTTNKDWDEVATFLDEAEKANPDAYQIQLLRAEVLHSQNRDQDAEKLLQKTLDKYPKQLECWNALVSIYALQDKWDEAEKQLDEYQKQNGDSVEHRLARAEYLMRRYNTKAGEHLSKLADNIDSFSDADKIQLWNGLLTAARRTGNNELIKTYTNLLAAKDTNNLEIQFLKVEQAANNEDEAALEAALKDVEKIEGKGPLWLFGQARLLAVRSVKENKPELLDETLQYLVKAQEERSSWSRIPLFMGSIYDMQKKPDLALKMYLKAIDMGERSPTAVRRAVQMLTQQQKYADADKLLSQLARQNVPFTPELTRLWVQLLIQQGEFETALEKARQAVSDKSDNYSEHLWLGQILGIASRRAKTQLRIKDYQDLAVEAEKSLRRAVELNGNVAETWVALVEFLSKVDKLSDAAEAISQAQQKIPPEKAPIALAQCFEAIEKNDKAMEQYELAIAAKPDDPVVVSSVADFYKRIGKTVESEAQLRRILDGKVKADDATVAWARRQLAMIIASKGGLKNVEAARNLIEQNLAAAANSPEDLRFKARLDANDPRRSYKDEAINILSKMMEGQLATPEDRFSLAMLYLAIDKQQSRDLKAGDEEKKDSSAWRKASEILRNLAISQDSEPRYMAVYTKELLDHGEVSGAELYLNKLVKDFPNAAVTIILQSEILLRRNQYEEALDLMKSFVDRKNAMPADRSTRIRLMADSMEQLAAKLSGPDQQSVSERYLRTAAEYVRLYVDEHPSQSMDLVMFYIRQGQIEEAVNFLQQNWQNSDATSVAQVCMNIIQNKKCPKELTEKVESVLSEARTKFDNHPSILVTLGDIRVFQNRFSEAETFYRDVLSNNLGHAVALNNLAVLQTLQGQKLDEALSLINKAIEITGPVGSMLDTRACVYIARGDAAKAVSDMEECIADSVTPVRLFHQAQALNLAKQKYAASSAMQRALKLGLTKDSLHSTEIPAFEILQKQAKESGSSSEANK